VEVKVEVKVEEEERRMLPSGKEGGNGRSTMDV
jgi:hypothetical protein